MTLALDRSDQRGQLDRPAVRAALRVLVVDDHRAFAELLAGALKTAGMAVLGTAYSAARAVAMAQELQPDVVVMDIQMPRQDGLAATRRLREVAPFTVVAVVSDHRDPEWVVRATQAGASAFIPKEGSLAEMLDVLTRVRAGQMLIAPSTFATAPSDGTRPAPESGVRPQLTRREQEVLDCLGSGMHIKAIARVLGITLETCRGYAKALYTKLGVHSQLEAVVKAQQLGLLSSAAA
ncbi:response regulator transcription factor [Geodermatophilus sp. DSM 45219]|uniref:response regulator transcription factor n=1 Tax=Geodermatophilus sp. DSM 45219 TaxID=1881103 RepID=UPI00089170D8|nr:response regulator transcription factor [Geodermatophilus sp. DSM 45219]SDO50114.1 DNA-binding response regulator, NarL/FixJ family, contains REC and HTH domains [Geodermatophilus sp. DSM 45219]